MTRWRAPTSLIVFSLLAACTRSQVSAEKRAGEAPSASAPLSANAAAIASSAAPVASLAPSARDACLTPESAGVGPLVTLSGETSGERAALSAARAELERLLEAPADYFGSVQSAGDLVLVELWHRSAFPPHGCTAPAGSGAKRRTLGYDPRKQRIVSSKVWEPELEGEGEPGARPAR